MTNILLLYDLSGVLTMILHLFKIRIDFQYQHMLNTWVIFHSNDKRCVS